MAIDRRGFLRSLLGGAVGLAIAPTLDLDKLLWVPGAKSIFLPAVPRITLAEIDEITRRVILPGVVDNFFKSAPLLSYLKSPARTWEPRPMLIGPQPPANFSGLILDAHDYDFLTGEMRDR